METMIYDLFTTVYGRVSVNSFTLNQRVSAFRLPLHALALIFIEWASPSSVPYGWHTYLSTSSASSLKLGHSMYCRDVYSLHLSHRFLLTQNVREIRNSQSFWICASNAKTHKAILEDFYGSKHRHENRSSYHSRVCSVLGIKLLPFNHFYVVGIDLSMIYLVNENLTNISRNDIPSLSSHASSKTSDTNNHIASSSYEPTSALQIRFQPFSHGTGLELYMKSPISPLHISQQI